MGSLRKDAQAIISEAIESAMPDQAVERAIGRIYGEKEPEKGNRHGVGREETLGPAGRLVVIAAGKAAWQMAKAASDSLTALGISVDSGIVVTKYDHVKGRIPAMECYEAGHPIPDENSFAATEKAIEAVKDLTEEDQVLFLLSGGGSALFEKPLVSPKELQDITAQLLACGADIVEINTIRKRISSVKGGRFAEICAPAKVCTIVLSDIIGDPLDMIASGPAYPDSSTGQQAQAIVKKYGLRLSDEGQKLLQQETPKTLNNVETFVTGSVKQLCQSAKASAERLGYVPVILTEELNIQAREAGAFLGAIGKSHRRDEKSVAFIAGGETVVRLIGQGKGGRNQELALAAAPYIAGLDNVAVFSVGSDGTDGPTDAAGGYADGHTAEAVERAGRTVAEILDDNDAYTGLQLADGLIFTGPTGTNVNDLAVVLIQGEREA